MMKSSPRRGVAYIRVSTAQQELSPDAQRERLRQYAAFNSIDLPDSHIIVDLATSGRVAFESRDLGQKALRLLLDGDSPAPPADIIIFAKLSRAFRNAADALTLVPRLLAAGKDVAFLDLGISVSTPTGKMVMGMLAVQAEWEVDIISERTREALSAARSQGRRIGGVPLGFRSAARVVDGRRIDAGMYVPVPEEQATIERIVQLRRDAEMSFREIAKHLTAEGLLTKRGGRWAGEQVRRVCMRHMRSGG